jgi:hypothetical protein
LDRLRDHRRDQGQQRRGVPLPADHPVRDLILRFATLLIALAAAAPPKGDTASGLIYTYENPNDPSGADRWYWTAVDYRTGRIAWRQLAGYGSLFNNFYAGIALGQAPRGKPTLYVGGIGGIVALRDG